MGFWEAVRKMFAADTSEGEAQGSGRKQQVRRDEREAASGKSAEEVEDPHEKKKILEAQARVLAQDGQEFHDVLRESNRQDLLRFKQGGLYDHVQIIAAGCCEECEKRDGDVMPLEEALRTEPLPQERCRRFIDSEVYEEGWCVCSWTFEDSEGSTGEKLPT